jgi:hypothetical protein
MNHRIFLAVSIALSLLSAAFGFGAGTAFAQLSGNQRPNATWTQRVITEKELQKISEKDMDLSPSASLRILAKLNARDFDYIAQDIRDRKPLKVPNDFAAFKDWTPFNKYIADVSDLPKFILVVKDLPHIGWYERGRLVGDTYICVGKVEGTTKEGLYTVQEKDVDHRSRSYPNAFGEPAPMPWALRIYGTVWIHAGDIASGYCSHGCINLPIFSAEKLFDWASPGTPVLVVDSLGAVPSVFSSKSL